MNLLRFKFKSSSQTPLIRQHEYTECGLACLAMVLGHYGHETSISELRRQYEVSEDAGTSMANLALWAGEKGLDGRVLQGTIKQLKQVRLPLIAFWRNTHFVVVVEADERGIVIHDPACGVRRYTYQEAEPFFSGYVLELRPAADFSVRKNEEHFTLSHLARLITQLVRRQLTLFLMSVFTLIIMLISPAYLQLVLDEAVARNDFDLVIVLTTVFAIVFLFDAASKFLKQILTICLRNFAYDELSQAVRGRLLCADTSWFRTRPVGVVLAIEKSLHSCAEFISNGYVALIYSLLIGLCSMVFMLFYNVKIAMITFALMGVFFLIRFVLIGPYQRAVDNSISKTAEYESVLVETQKGIITLKANNMLSHFNQVIDRAMRSHISALMKKERLLTRFDVASILVINAEQLVVICMGAWAILQGEMTIGMLVAYISYKRYFSDSMIEVAHKFLEKNALQGPLERIGDLVTYPTDGNNFGEKRLDTPKTLTFNDMTYAWPGKKPVLKNIDLTLRIEQETVIVGHSGGGKTTLLRLIAGMIQPTEGTIELNNEVLTNWDLTSLRQQMRIIHADDQLFSGSIMANIAGFEAEPDSQRVTEACRLACIDEVISALPHRYETNFIPGNPLFSAGEVQRLVLARALYASPKWLLCDEVTANLDRITARRVLENLRSLNIGLIFVTHSPEVVYQEGLLLQLEMGQLTNISLESLA